MDPLWLQKVREGRTDELLGFSQDALTVLR
jgi:hypothetical protein